MSIEILKLLEILRYMQLHLVHVHTCIRCRTSIIKVPINEISINGKFGIIRNLVSCLLNLVEERLENNELKPNKIITFVFKKCYFCFILISRFIKFNL